MTKKNSLFAICGERAMPTTTTTDNHDGDDHQLPPTDMLYMTYEGNWLTECTSKVLSVEELPKNDDADRKKNGVVTGSGDKEKQQQTMVVCLDRTVMHAQGGGQPTDLGRIIGSTNCSSSSSSSSDDVLVLDVTKVIQDRDTGVARHIGTFFTSSSCKQQEDDDDNNSNNESRDDTIGFNNRCFQIGETVKVMINQDVRKVLSECHSAGHVVDAAMARCGKHFKPTKAYHFLEGPYVEYEGTIDDAKEREKLLVDLQKAFCQLIDDDIATEITSMTKDEANIACNDRQAQNFDMDVFSDTMTGRVRVVKIAGYSCPCGGTHIRTTSELKDNEWNVISIKCKKGLTKVKYDRNKKKSTKK